MLRNIAAAFSPIANWGSAVTSKSNRHSFCVTEIKSHQNTCFHHFCDRNLGPETEMFKKIKSCMYERLHKNQVIFQAGGGDGELEKMSNEAARHPGGLSATQQENQASSALEGTDTPVYMSLRVWGVSCSGPVFLCTGTRLSPRWLHKNSSEDVCAYDVRFLSLPMLLEFLVPAFGMKRRR